MTGFDNIMRSQGMVAQHQMGQDQLRHDAMRGQAQAIGDFGQTLQRERQLNMQQQAMQSQLAQVQQELALQQTDANMRLQEHEQRMQINAAKLVAMQQIDQADLMRAEVETAQASAKMAKLAAAKAERDAASYGEDRLAQMEADVLRFSGGVEGLHISGHTYDSALPFGSRIRPYSNETERGEAAKRFAETKARSTTSTTNQDRLLLAAQIKALEEAQDYEGADALRNELLALPRPGAGAPSAPGASAPRQITHRPASDPRIQEATAETLRSALVTRNARHRATGPSIDATLDSGAEERLSGYLSANKAKIASEFRAGETPGRGGGLSDDGVIDVILGILAAGPSDARYRGVMMKLAADGAISDATFRALER